MGACVPSIHSYNFEVRESVKKDIKNKKSNSRLVVWLIYIDKTYWGTARKNNKKVDSWLINRAAILELGLEQLYCKALRKEQVVLQLLAKFSGWQGICLKGN